MRYVSQRCLSKHESRSQGTSAKLRRSCEGLACLPGGPGPCLCYTLIQQQSYKKYCKAALLAGKLLLSCSAALKSLYVARPCSSSSNIDAMFPHRKQ